MSTFRQEIVFHLRGSWVITDILWLLYYVCKLAAQIALAIGLRLALLYLVPVVDPMDFHTWPGIDITQLRLTKMNDSAPRNDAYAEAVAAGIILIAVVNWIIIEFILLAFKALRLGVRVFGKFQSWRSHKSRVNKRSRQ